MAWISRKVALERMGLPLSQLRRLIRAGILKPRGKGRGQRYRAEKIDAVVALWEELDDMLPAATVEDEIDDDE